MHTIKKPFILSIFGASGDLARLKLFPALYALMELKKLPEEFYIVGFARTKMTKKEFQKLFEESVLKSRKIVNKTVLKSIIDRTFYFTGQYTDKEDFKHYKAYLKRITKEKTLSHIVYFSVPPTVFKSIIQNIAETMKPNGSDMKLVIEKPFGEDKTSAKELFHFTARYFSERQIYLLDHYLGKTSVQSLLPLRHANSILNLILKGNHIANIQITAFEDIGVQDRIGYFDQVGTLKDMIQSHLLQVLAYMTMSIPVAEKSVSVRREKYAILSALQFSPSSSNIVLGQYKSYRNLKGVAKNSNANTFVALRLFLNRESWYKVPIYIRTGKMLHEKHTFIVIEFKKFAFQRKNEPPNRLIVELAPEERISLKLIIQQEGASTYQDIMTSHSIACEGEDCLSEHATLLFDVMSGERLHFLSFPEIIASWRVTDSIVQCIKEKKVQVERYEDGSSGLESHHRLVKKDGFEWFDIH